MGRATRHLAASAAVAAVATGALTALTREVEPVAPLMDIGQAGGLARAAADALSMHLSSGAQQGALVAVGITGVLSLPVLLSAAIAERTQDRVRWRAMPSPDRHEQQPTHCYRLERSEHRIGQNGIPARASALVPTSSGLRMPAPGPGWMPDAVAGQVRWWDGQCLTERVASF